jgi:FkbM family methyltransferase
MSTALNIVEPSARPVATALLGELLELLPSLRALHAPGSAFYRFLKRVARQQIEQTFASTEPAAHEVGPFGPLVFPYESMGAVSTLNLFDLDELIIFSFYWANRRRYRRVLDIGANLGLHAILLDRCGFEVRAYEPDPRHFELLERNFRLNGCTRIQAVKAAVSTRDGEFSFVRVLGNTTGSHLAGAKPNPYGALERFPVRVEGIAPLFAWADLVKLDAEGHEADILLATTAADWHTTDALVEVGSERSARALYCHFTTCGVNLFAQKIGWERVQGEGDMPTSYREGTLFVTVAPSMPWTA